jgi:hypothetical protein
MSNKLKIEFRQGFIEYYKGGIRNTTGYYIYKKILFLFWVKVAGPFRHIQQAEKEMKLLQNKFK